MLSSRRTRIAGALQVMHFGCAHFASQ